MKAAITAVLLCLPALAGAMPAELEAAFARMPPVDSSQWAFTEIIDDGEKVMRQRHDPRGEERWALLSVDGEAPDQDDLEEFDKRIERRQSDERDEPGDNDFVDLAEPESWTLLDETPETARYSFKPRRDDDEMGRFAEHLEGELTLDRRRGVVESFAIRSIEPFRVRLVASIRFLETVIRMQAIDDEQFFPDTIETTVRGKAFGMKSIDRSVTIRYRDFEYVGPAHTATTAE